jgi:hypothetical protein
MPWVKKLKAENVTFLRQPYKIRSTRVMMIEGPAMKRLSW